jgi:hypothetical protein
MVASVQSPADVINLALVRIGYKLRIGSLFDGTPASKAALDIYAQTRDETLREFDWGFAERNLAATLLKSAPPGGYVPPAVWNPLTNPPLPWNYEYQYPADCLKLRSIRGTPLFIPEFDPRPKVFRIVNDNAFNPPQRVILTNEVNALLVYTGQVTDPTTWEPLYVEALAASLARRLAPYLADLKMEQAEAQDEGAATVMAESKLG